MVFACLLALVSLMSVEAAYIQINGTQMSNDALSSLVATKFMELVNKYRLAHNLTPLKSSNGLKKLSARHALNLTRFSADELAANNDLRNSVAHENYEERRQAMKEAVVRESGKSLSKTIGGEITQVAWAFITYKDSQGNILVEEIAQSILDNFLASAGHRAIIETDYPAGSYFGAGVVVSGWHLHLVCNFIGVQ